MQEKFPLTPTPPQQPSPEHTYDSVMRRLSRTPLVANLAAAAIACSPAKKERPVEKRGTETVKLVEDSDKRDDFFKEYEGGRFTPEERVQRTKILRNGEVVFEDVGLTFYRVKKGDTVASIREALARYQQFAYLSDQKMKLQSFNIPTHELKAGMWIPIPIKNTDRHITDKEFVESAASAIEKLKDDETYGEAVKTILARGGMTEKKLVASMLAVAKQESGGQPLGCFEFHRWEGKGSHNEFSFSMFHVLMSGPGLDARYKLNMTEGQTYNSENAVKLFIAFLVEKAKETSKGKAANKKIAQFFPFTKKSLKNFATFYNGKGWRINNRSYPTNLMKFYKDALETVDDPKTPTLPALR